MRCVIIIPGVRGLTVVYIDRVFVLNAAVDYLLLLTAAQLMGAPLRRWRLGIAAGLGGGYAAAVFALSWLGLPTVRILVGILLATIAFWGERHLWRHIALFLLLSGALAGLILAIGFLCGTTHSLVQRVYYADIGWWTLLGATALFYLLLELLFRQEARFSKGEIMDITVSLAGKTCHLRTLYDSGNTLRNPIDGTAVLVAETEALDPLWNAETNRILVQPLSPEEKLTRLYQNGDTAFSLLPFRSVGRESGLLLAVRSDYIQIGRRICPKTLVALYPDPIGGAAYHGLWGGKGRADATDCDNTTVDPSAPG